MVTSRYDTPTGSLKDATDNRTASVGSSSQNQTGNQSQTSNQQQNTSGTQTQTTQSNTQNMSGNALAALDRLITQLMNGGTPEMKANAAQREGQKTIVKNQQEGYTKTAAFADAQGLIAQQMRRALESMMPSISRAAEDAGSSGGALRAMLMQDAADKAAQSSSALGVQTAAQYGQVFTGLSQVFENLLRQNPTTDALLQALNTAKGAVQNTTSTSTVNSNQQTNTQGTVNTSSSQTVDNKENKQTFTDYAPFTVDTTPKFFGADTGAPQVSYAGSSAHTMKELAGLLAPNAWDSYKI